jgi:MIP family channel proteins
MFVYIGCGTAIFFSAPSNFDFSAKLSGNTSTYSPTAFNSSFGIATALSFGLTIVGLVYTFASISGGHVNSAVTWGLFLAKRITVGQLVSNTIAQFSGSIIGAALLYGTVPFASESGMGSNSISAGATVGNAVLGEICMTFALVFVVLVTTTKYAADSVGKLAPLAIGLIVFAGHAVLLPLDGCSINPSRSFGPAIFANQWDDFWVFIVGPYVGSTFAALAYYSLNYGLDTAQTSEAEAADASRKKEKHPYFASPASSSDTLVSNELVMVQTHKPDSESGGDK